MNVNEIIANQALELLGKEKEDYTLINPKNHVNMSHSTNTIHLVDAAQNIDVLQRYLQHLKFV